MPYAIFFVRGVAFHGTNVTSRWASPRRMVAFDWPPAMLHNSLALVHKHGFAKTQIVVFGAAKHHPAAVAHRAPTPRIESTASSGLPSWAKVLFRSSP